jgi:hypothetical protein
MLSVIMLNVVMLSVIMLNVVAPLEGTDNYKHLSINGREVITAVKCLSIWNRKSSTAVTLKHLQHLLGQL